MGVVEVPGEFGRGGAPGGGGGGRVEGWLRRVEVILSVAIGIRHYLTCNHDTKCRIVSVDGWWYLHCFSKRRSAREQEQEGKQKQKLYHSTKLHNSDRRPCRNESARRAACASFLVIQSAMKHQLAWTRQRPGEWNRFACKLCSCQTSDGSVGNRRMSRWLGKRNYLVWSYSIMRVGGFSGLVKKKKIDSYEWIMQWAISNAHRKTPREVPRNHTASLSSLPLGPRTCRHGGWHELSEWGRILPNHAWAGLKFDTPCSRIIEFVERGLDR
jgi:hypothetical protein